MREHARWAAECLLLAGVLCAVEVGLIRGGVASVDGVVLVWPSAGLAIAGLAFLGPSRWPGVLVGSFATTWLDAEMLIPMLGLKGTLALAVVPALADAGEALLGVWALGVGFRWIGFREGISRAALFRGALFRGALLRGRGAWLRRTADVARFLLLAGLVGPALNTAVSLGTLVGVGRLSRETVLEGAQAWYVSGLIGSLVVTPALVIWAQPARREVLWGRPVGGVLALVALGVFSVVAFGPVSQVLAMPAVVVFAVGLLLLLWLASSWHQAGATAGLLVMTLAVVVGTSLGYGPVRGLLENGQRLQEGLLNLQLVIALVSATVLLSGAVASERATQLAALRRSRAMLEDNRDRLTVLGRRLLHELASTRQRLATQLHDGPTQQIALAQLALDEATPKVEEGERQKLRRSAEHLSEAMTQARAVMADLSPPVLGRLGLEAGLRALCSRVLEQHGEFIHLSLGLDGRRLPPEFEAFFYTAARELLGNALGHAQAQRIELSLEPLGRSVQLSVTDDGVGMDAARAMRNHADDRDAESYPGAGAGMSLYRLRRYVAPLGGVLHIDSRPGRTRVTLRLPIEDDDADGRGGVYGWDSKGGSGGNSGGNSGGDSGGGA